MKSWFDWKSHDPSLVFGRKCNEEANIEAPMFWIPKHTTGSQVVVARRKLADISSLDGVDVRLSLTLPLLLCSCVHFRINQSNFDRDRKGRVGGIRVLHVTNADSPVIWREKRFTLAVQPCLAKG